MTAEESLTEGVSVLERLAGEDPGRHNADLGAALYALGEHAAEAGRWEAAEPPLRRAAELFRAISCVDTGRNDDVVARISGWPRATGGDLRNALAVLGLVQLKLGRIDGAERSWRELLHHLDASPSGPTGEAEYVAQALMNLGMLYMEWGREADALEAMDGLAQLAHSNPRILAWVQVREAGR